MRYPTLLTALVLTAPLFGQSGQPIDTAAVTYGIDQYMMRVDRSPVVATYVRMTEGEPAKEVENGSGMPPGATELIELRVDSAGHVVGAATSGPERLNGVKESTYHYFSSDHNTVAVRHELKWLGNGCTFSDAVRMDFQYFHPPRNTILEYTTLTDVEGNNLDPLKCTFPNIVRTPEVYYHLDMFLLMERLELK